MKRYDMTWFVLVAVSLLVLVISPTSFARGQDYSGSSEAEAETERNDYGIYARLKGISDKEKGKLDDPQMLEESQGTLDQYEFVDSALAPYADRSRMTLEKTEEPAEIYEKNIFDIINERAPFAEDNDILNLLFDFNTGITGIIPRPNLSNYWIYTNFSGHEEWTKGTLRQRLELHMEDNRLKVIKSTWAEIDVDGDPATGDADGDDIRVRLTPDLSGPTLMELIEKALAGGGISLDLTGGFSLQAEALSEGELPWEELKLYVLKPITYEGKNTIAAVGFNFPRVPSGFEAKVIASKILLANIIRDTLEKLINGGIAELGNVTVLEALGGPYKIQYFLDEGVESLYATIGLGQLVQQGEHMALKTKEIIEVDLMEAAGKNGIPRSGQLWLNNEEEGLVAPIDDVRWTANLNDEGGPEVTKARIGYLEMLSGMMTRAKTNIENLPRNLSLRMDYTKVKNGKNVTEVDLDSCEGIGSVDYQAYEFPDISDIIGEENETYNFSIFKSVHTKIGDIPPKAHIEVTSDINRELDTPGINNSGGIVSRLLDTTLIRILDRFQRLGRNLRALPENLMTIPGKKGFLHLTAQDGQVGELEFSRTSSYLLKPEMDESYICSLNLTPYQDPFVTELIAAGILPDTSISGRFYNISDLHMSFETHTMLELTSSNPSALYVDLRDPAANATAWISNLPSYFKIDAMPEAITYTSSPGSVIEGTSVYAEMEGVKVDLQVTEAKEGFEIVRGDEGVLIRSLGGEIGTLKIYVANGRDSVEKISGNEYAIVSNITEQSSSAFINLFGLKKIEYIPGDAGILNIETAGTSPFFMGVNNKVDNNGISSRMLIEPLPNNLSIGLPGVIDVSSVQIPNLSNLTGVLDLTDTIFALGDVGLGLISLMANASQTFASSIGGMGSNMDLNYHFDSDLKMDIVAEMRQNFSVDIEEPPWVHGVAIQKNESSGSEDASWAKIFLTGLPNEGRIESIMDDRIISWNISFQDMSPRYDYMSIDTQGLRGRKIHAFLTGFKQDMDIELNTYLNTYLGEDVGEMRGNVNIRTSESLGEMYMRIIRQRPIPSIREIYLPKVPTTLETDFSLARTLDIDWKASEPMDLGFIKMSKFIQGRWRPMVSILHDVPASFSLDLVPTTGYDFSSPPPVQGLPNINFEASSPGLDAHITMDGMMGGQKGRMNVRVRDLSTELKTRGGGESYVIESKGKVGLISLIITDMPMAREYSLDFLNIDALNVEHATVKVKMIFGIYPVFRLSNVQADRIKLKFDGEMNLFGMRSDIKAVVADFRGESVPSPVGVHGNDIYVEAEADDKKIWLVPMPLVTYLYSSG